MNKKMITYSRTHLSSSFNKKFFPSSCRFFSPVRNSLISLFIPKNIYDLSLNKCKTPTITYYNDYEYDRLSRYVQKHHYFPYASSSQEGNGYALRKMCLHITFKFSHYLRSIFNFVTDK